MTDPDVDSHVQTLVRRFDEDLNRARFRTLASGNDPSEWKWTGKIGPNRERAEIALTVRFPYGPPDVVLPDRPGHSSWHRDVAGVLCLWDTHSQGDLPWLDVSMLLDRVLAWIDNDDDGWTDDEPALDLEAYHEPYLMRRGQRIGLPLLVIDDWPALAGHWFWATAPNEYGRVDIIGGRRLAPPDHAKPKSGRRERQRRHQPLDGLAVDLGEMTVPLIETADLLAALGQHRASAEAVLAAGRPVLLACRYTRLGAIGLIGFWMTLTGDKMSRPYFEVAERSASQRRRAGWHAATIEDQTVSVVGAGSVGSYVADMLHRSGVRRLHVHDYDRLKPGNLVRHTAPFRYVGAPKTDAVREVAADRESTHQIEGAGWVRTLADAVTLLRERDLVVDCTGDRLTWQLLLAASKVTGKRFLHVAVEGHGQYARVDVCPPFGGADELPNDGVRPMTLTELEGGCGDPVSPTPPVAAFEAAAIGARLAIRVLAGEPVPPGGERRELFPVGP
jgi:molybdopterin/thiamine biosynthesis adenylyltransferase